MADSLGGDGSVHWSADPPEPVKDEAQGEVPDGGSIGDRYARGLHRHHWHQLPVCGWRGRLQVPGGKPWRRFEENISLVSELIAKMIVLSDDILVFNHLFSMLLDVILMKNRCIFYHPWLMLWDVFMPWQEIVLLVEKNMHVLLSFDRQPYHTVRTYQKGDVWKLSKCIAWCVVKFTGTLPWHIKRCLTTPRLSY